MFSSTYWATCDHSCFGNTAQSTHRWISDQSLQCVVSFARERSQVSELSTQAVPFQWLMYYFHFRSLSRLMQEFWSDWLDWFLRNDATLPWYRNDVPPRMEPRSLNPIPLAVLALVFNSNSSEYTLEGCNNNTDCGVSRIDKYADHVTMSWPVPAVMYRRMSELS